MYEPGTNEELRVLGDFVGRSVAARFTKEF
jgi:hypothetical protein